MLKLAGELIEGQLADHMANLDAHTFSIFERLLVGGYYMSLLKATYGASSGGAITANKLYAIPFPVPRKMTWDRIAIQVVTEDAVNSNLRMGIYKDNGAVYPSDLVIDAGVVDVSTTGMKTITINQQLTKGLYWLVFIADGTPSIYKTSDHLHIMGRDTMVHYNYAGYSKADTYGALADPFPAGAVGEYSLWAIGLRLVSLD